MASIKDLKFDDKNFNKHTEYGMSLLEKSLRKHGAGRSILLDKDNNIIAGNGVVEIAGQIGLEKVKIVETTGDEIVAVKRTDISLDTKEGREIALDDNATAKVDIEWDKETLKDEFEEEELIEHGVDAEWDDLPDELEENEEKEDGFIVKVKFENYKEFTNIEKELRALAEKVGADLVIGSK